MAKRGRKPKLQQLKVVAGTDQPSRKTEQAFEPLEGVPELPPSFSGLREENPSFAREVLALWNRKIARYQQRGQPVVGYEDFLYATCLFEAQMHERKRLGIPVTASDLNTLRLAHSEFFDTPAGNVQTERKKSNPFDKHKRPPS